jgi:hypothetical protein
MELIWIGEISLWDDMLRVRFSHARLGLYHWGKGNFG